MGLVTAIVSDFYYAACASPLEKQARAILTSLYKAEFQSPEFNAALEELREFAPQYGIMDLWEISARTQLIRNNFAKSMEQRGERWILEKRMHVLETQYALFKELSDNAATKDLFHQVIHDLACIHAHEINARSAAMYRVNSAAIKAVHAKLAIENGAMENYTFGGQARAMQKRNHQRWESLTRMGHPDADDLNAIFK